MKKNDFIKSVLASTSNTIFTEEGQVDAAIDLFTKLGMLPPLSDEFISTNQLHVVEAVLEDAYFIYKWDE